MSQVFYHCATGVWPIGAVSLFFQNFLFYKLVSVIWFLNLRMMSQLIYYFATSVQLIGAVSLLFCNFLFSGTGSVI